MNAKEFQYNDVVINGFVALFVNLAILPLLIVMSFILFKGSIVLFLLLILFLAAAILMICFTLIVLTACAGTTDSKDNNDDNALIQGTWEIDTGSGAGYKFVDDKFMWLKSIENVNDNYWYGDVEYYNGAEAMEIAGLTEEELKSSLPGLKPENIFVTKLDPEKIITDGEDKTATNMNDQTLWTRLWLIEENEDNVVAVVFDLETFSMESYTKVK